MTARRSPLDDALGAWRRGDLATAERLLSSHLAQRPKDAKALGLLGTVRARRGDLAAAADLLEKATRLDPKDAGARFNLGNVQRNQGRTADAVAAFRAAVKLAPRSPEAHVGLAVALLDQGEAKEAEQLCRRAIGLKADLADAHNTLGIALRAQDRPKEAEAAFSAALTHAPRHGAALSNLGNLLSATGRAADAVEVYSQALAADPDNPDTQYNLGNTLFALKRVDEAEQALRGTLARNPRHGPALGALANVLVGRGRHDEAVGLFREALGAAPDSPDILYNLANTQRDLGRADEAEATYRRVLDLNPNHAQARQDLLLASCYNPAHTPAEVFALHRKQGDAIAAAAAGRARTRHANAPDPGRRLRVGYLSPDLRRHPVAGFMEPVLAHHDPGVVEVTGYAAVTHPDATTERLRALAHHWVNVTPLSDEALADRIAADGIDILVELAGHTGGSRLSAVALRPAPVQVSYLGYPATTGLSAIGYRLTDAACDPPGTEAFHTERLVRLDGGFCAYAPPEDVPPVTPAPAIAAGHATFGSLINPQKLNEGVIALWARVLAETPGSRLLLFRTTLRHEAVRRPYREAFAVHGIDPERVEFAWEMPPGGHMAAYARLDACLDTFPFCGHTTTCEALWMGVPTVTLAGLAFAGRMGVSVNTTVGLTHLIAEDEDGFVAAAAALAADVDALADLRAGLRERVRASPLCDGAGFTRRLEAAYRAMWTDWCTGRQVRPNV